MEAEQEEGGVMLEQFETVGEVTDTGFKFDDQASVRRMMSGFKRGKVLATFKAYRPKRSDAQNRFWHGVVIPAFAEHCGYEFAEMKDALALQLIPREVSDLTTAEVRTIPGHTSDLNTKEFNDLIERAQRLGAEMGIVIPDPGEDVTGRKGRAA